MNIHPIRTKAEHRQALARISKLMILDPAPRTPESDELEVLAQVVESYEKKAHDLGFPTPVELIAFAMEQRGLTNKDMVPFLGSASRVSEVLNGKRGLTLPMIANLHRGLGLPLTPLVMGSAFKPVATRRSAASPRQSIPSAKGAQGILAKQRMPKAVSA